MRTAVRGKYGTLYQHPAEIHRPPALQTPFPGLSHAHRSITSPTFLNPFIWGFPEEVIGKHIPKFRSVGVPPFPNDATWESGGQLNNPVLMSGLSSPLMAGPGSWLPRGRAIGEDVASVLRGA
ncbi:unnamed protein product [Arctogadus glacialis]